jgi:Spy/CpxP family protein refolding chaperone
MKVVKTLLLISIVAALFVSVAFAAEPAQPVPPPRAPAPGGPGGQRMGMGRMMNPARMVIAMRVQLNLTDEQVTKLEALKPADPNAVQHAQQDLIKLQTELNAAVVAADTAKIKGLCAKLGDATEKTSLLQAKMYTQIKQILTPDQFKQLQQMMSGPMGMGGGMGGGRMGGGPGGQRPGGPPGGPPPEN